MSYYTHWLLTLPLSTIQMVGTQRHIEPELIAAIIQVESAGQQFVSNVALNSDVVEPSKYATKNGMTKRAEEIAQQTAYGYCQVLGSTARRLGFTRPLGELYMELTNIRLATMLLVNLKKRYEGHRDSMISAYNYGQVIKRKDGTFINQSYVNKVNKYYKEAKESGLFD